ncbi:LANO_0E12596g1_1 [Lachancea nothofagi CBS 11611]|uniref:Spindle pole body component n=1 Tax=Lachancea nothofagi CBS 11611 TaxID=1266666 RepID=A0A1G4JYG3_9SACH|nr:LANO_0E12596g1_1 [Lachancea nothofagi CBS 11611]
MDLRNNLSLIVNELMAPVLPGVLMGTLEDELNNLLTSSPVNIERINRLVHKYKSSTVQDADSYARWQKLENLLQLVAASPNQEEASAYLRLMKNMMESTGQQKRPSLKLHESSLSTHLLESHDNMMTPIKNSRSSPVYAESFENIDRYSDRRSIVSSNYGGMARDRNSSVTLSSLSDPYYSCVVNEKEIMNYLPFTLLATTSQMFTFDKRGVHIPENIPNGESGMLHILFEAGLLYRFIQKQIDTYRTTNALSPLKTAFLTFVNQQLHEYMAVVNRISNSPHIRSLKALYIDIKDWILEFRIYYNLMIDFQQLRGDHLLSRVHDLKDHGDLLVKRVSNSLYGSLDQIYYQYLVNWLTRSQLDTHQEFFVETVLSPDHGPTSLKLNMDKVPTFISAPTAKEIYMIGKTSLFLEKECMEIQWINDCNQKYFKVYGAMKGNAVSLEFCDAVRSHHSEINSFCKSTLESKYSFSRVLDMLKDVLLMGRGDFIDQMICNSADFLQQSSAILPSYKLTRCLQESIKQSSLRYMLATQHTRKIVDGIDARVLELGHGSIGWDVFTLDYLAEQPLATILEFDRSGGRKVYLRIFNFLWRIKKNNFFFQEQWSRNNTLARDFRRLRRNKPLVRDILKKMYKVNALKSNVQHFNRKIESYCFQSIIEKNYVNLRTKISDERRDLEGTIKKTKIKNGLVVAQGILRPQNLLMQKIGMKARVSYQKHTPSIDELRQIHDEYLQKVVCNKLLDSASPNRRPGTFSKQYYPSTLILMLNDLFEFILRYSEFNDVIHDLLIHLSLQSSDEVSELLKKLNDLLSKIVAHYRWIQKTSYYLIKDLKADGDTELLSLSKILR